MQFLIVSLAISMLPFVCSSDDDMFDFARSQIDRSSVVVRTRGRSFGKRPKIVPTGTNNYYLNAQMQVGKGNLLLLCINLLYLNCSHSEFILLGHIILVLGPQFLLLHDQLSVSNLFSNGHRERYASPLQ